jgi:protocatechuate 3,4-dioxygenase alpha subunit
VKSRATTSQTVGPFLSLGCEQTYCADPTTPGTLGERMVVGGKILDGVGVPVPDAGVEIWQADSHGKSLHPQDTQDKPSDAAFGGFGLVATNDHGAFHLRTVKPGPVPGPRGSMQARHLLVLVFMRGLLKHLVTRVHFPDDPSNPNDPVLNLVDSLRRQTLIARSITGNPGSLGWNVILQGPEETVFFDC